MNIVFFDIDGTLAIGKDVPESAKRALHQLRMNGSLIFICTGRSLSYVRKNFYQYANGYVVSNGRLAWMGCCERLYDHPVEKELLQEIMQKMDEEGAGYALFDEQYGYYFGDPEGYEKIAAVYDPSFMKKEQDISKKNIYAFDVWFRNKEHRERIAEALQGICLLNPHGDYPTADVTVLGVDKGTAVRAVAERLGVPIENTYAFGDGINDLFMMEAAGHSVAMGNAVDAVKAKAEYVTTPILEDGVWNGLKHYGLI